ncbi:MAG: hypothetical protein L3J91_03660 [Thermoplasmata archaeon]|nr:hypothetical protein [Thermoplasmata archaeon]
MGLVCAYAAVATLPPAPPPSATLPPGVPPSVPGGNQTPDASTCNPSTPTPSAVELPIASPSGSLVAGGTLNVSYEIEIANYTSSQSGTVVYVPSLFATFPQSSGASTQLYLGPRSIDITSGSWTNASAATKSYSPSGTMTYSTASSVLSSEKLAVMATANYGTVTLELRWHWSTWTASGGNVNGAWSSPTRSSSGTSSLPSIFYPAPYVTLISTVGPNVLIGSDVGSELGGSVAGRYFFQELENSSSGKVFQSAGATAPNGASTFNVSIVMLNYDQYLDPGSYLLHIHDGCGAMLYRLSEKAAYAASANVKVVVQPSSCGPVTIDGTTHASGSSFSLRPSSSSYTFSVASCSGHTFKDWSASGGLHIVSAGALRVSASGTLTVAYT